MRSSQDPRKVFGIGMSKTGTTTLGACFEILGLEPHLGYDGRLKKRWQRHGDVEELLAVAARCRSLEDSPWYEIYRELDRRFPGSRFILTERADGDAVASSAWAHGVERGFRRGPMPDRYRNEKIREYERHGREVREHFAGRPDDLLVLSWERGDGWPELCAFLGLPEPGVPLPHRNPTRVAAAASALAAPDGDSRLRMLARRLRYEMLHLPPVVRVRRWLKV